MKAAAARVQSKPVGVGASRDPQEAEADRLAGRALDRRLGAPGAAGMPMIRRSATEAGSGSFAAPASVGRVLSDAGMPMEEGVRTDMESRFGHDFSQVRIHADPAAAGSARDIHARAYTAGAHIAFAAGRYAPHTGDGRRLIAHELAHVVQQQGSAGVIRRELDVEDFDAGDFDLPACNAYLETLKGGVIEDNSDSDDKARAVVWWWRRGNLELDAKQVALLIREMQSGFTGDDDERAILTLLENIDSAQIGAVFGAQALDAADLLSDFHGEEEDRLLSLFDARFEGGRDKALGGSAVVTAANRSVGGEGFTASSEADMEEVRRIIAKVRDQYGIDLDSMRGVAAVRDRYGNVPQSERDGVKVRPWNLDELQALERALKHYEPILGKMRSTSTRAAVAQEIVTVAKNEQSIDEDTDKGRLDHTTMGEYYESFQLFGLYEAAEGYDQEFPGDVPKQLESTIAHELSHGLLKYRLDDFVQQFDYWKDESTPDADPTTRVATKTVEAPITPYGSESADEDLAESAKYYFIDSSALKTGIGGKPKGTPGNPCPERFKFVDETVSAWKPAAGKGASA